MLDKAIAIAIMLFLLSMIAERFVNWLKLQFGREGHWLMGFSRKNEDLTVKTTDPDQEKLREQRILGLNLVVCVLLALLSHADLFAILNAGAPYSTIGWTNDAARTSLTGFPLVLMMVLGCILTGFFISLGSKFWHDLLDLLLYTKNLKEKIADPQTYEVSSVDQLQEYLKYTEDDMVHLAIEQNESILKKKFPNIHFINSSVSLINGKKKNVARIYLFDDKTAGLPPQIPVRLPTGKVYNVLTEFVTGSAMGKASMAMDGTVADALSPDFTGSACCIAADNQGNKFLITNCHVLTDGDLQDPLFNTGNDNVLYNGSKIGSWTFGSMDGKGDFAMVQLTDPDGFMNDNQVENFNNTFRDLTTQDNLLKVNVRGNVTSGAGFVIDVVQNKMGIEYNLGKTLTFDTAILLGNQPNKDTCTPASDAGDSGGVVFDDNNQLIGIITGKTPKFSIVIPIRQKATDLSLTII
jgi:hypothetical protein